MEELVEKASEIIKEASKIMLAREFTVKQKSSTADLVTSSDIAVQHFLEERLPVLLEGSAFFGEEGGLAGTESEYIWVVDPIDGTANFARDLGASVISVALLKNHKPYMGIVYNPYRDELFSAVEGGGAFLNGHRIQVSERPFNTAMLCSAMCLYEKKYSKPCFNIIERVYNDADDLRRLGTAAYELCCLAAGRVELYFEIRLGAWDYLAGYTIIKEAGGFIEIMFNDEAPLDKPAGIIAANSHSNFERLRTIVYDEISHPLY